MNITLKEIIVTIGSTEEQKLLKQKKKKIGRGWGVRLQCSYPCCIKQYSKKHMPNDRHVPRNGNKLTAPISLKPIPKHTHKPLFTMYMCQNVVEGCLQNCILNHTNDKNIVVHNKYHKHCCFSAEINIELATPTILAQLTNSVIHKYKLSQFVGIPVRQLS